ncbi:MAG TPA: cysteine desulfurase family protein [Verrucomicrobiota bacterium]|nr:cysteine desulfurase family protein [Verrucomicrobiota bacterium]
MRTIYCDYNATTPLDPAVRDAMLPFLSEAWGNPSSIHHVGRRVRASLDEARERASVVLRCKPSEVIFTSGGTESNNLAVFGTARLQKSRGRHIISSTIEHHAVLHCLDYLRKNEGFDVTLLPVNREGIVSVDSLKAAIRPDTILVSIMSANNEVGSLQPVSELGAVCRERGVLFHTDAVQWFGKEPFSGVDQFNADLVSVCAHKFHGPKGAGLLYIRSPLHPEPMLFGGAHENERRAGSENVAGIVGLAEAMEKFIQTPVFNSKKMLSLTEPLIEGLRKVRGIEVIGSSEARLENTVAFVVENTDSVALLAGLDLEGICASGGSACSAGSLEPSHVVRAMGYGDKLARALIRMSFGRENNREEIGMILHVVPDVVRRSITPEQPCQQD